MKMYRQGDLLIQEVVKLPDNLQIVEDGVILKGEVTGHSHRITKGELFKDGDGLMFLEVKSNGSIIHEEHNPIKLEKGFYAVIRQREYTSENMTRLVTD